MLSQENSVYVIIKQEGGRKRIDTDSTFMELARGGGRKKNHLKFCLFINTSKRARALQREKKDA
jgi:hypothetical protein